MKRLIAVATLFAASGPLPAQQSRTPAAVSLSNVLPAGVTPSELALTSDLARTYYIPQGTSTSEIWMYDRSRKTTARITSGDLWDLHVAPGATALAYTKTGESGNDEHIWIVPLDPRTGLASGPDRRVSMIPGDVPSISPDGQFVAFARDDSAGQSLVVVPIGGGPERVLAPHLGTGIGQIRWTPDSRTIFFGVNPRGRGGIASIQRVAASGGPVRTISVAGSVWPGLSPDASVLVFEDTATVPPHLRRAGLQQRLWVATDTTGRRLYTFVPPHDDAGWVNGATMALTTPWTMRRLHSYSLGDGRSRVLVDSLSRLWEPAWSPDGKSIATVNWVGQRCELRIYSPTGVLQRTVPMPELHGSGNMWSPDGRWIAYRGNPNFHRPAHINAIEIATGRVVQLGENTATSPALFDWRADSKGLVIWEVVEASPNRKFRLHEASLSGERRVLKDYALGSTTGNIRPIGTTEVIVSGGPNSEMRVVPITGNAPGRVLREASGTFSSLPVLSPDGQWVAIRLGAGSNNREMNKLEVHRVDGSGRVTIDLPFFAAPGQGNPIFLPGNAKVIVTENSTAGVSPSVYLVTLATRSVQKLLTVPREGARVPEVSLSPDGKTLLYMTRELAIPAFFTMDFANLRSGGR